MSRGSEVVETRDVILSQIEEAVLAGSAEAKLKLECIKLGQESKKILAEIHEKRHPVRNFIQNPSSWIAVASFVVSTITVTVTVRSGVISTQLTKLSNAEVEIKKNKELLDGKRKELEDKDKELKVKEVALIKKDGDIQAKEKSISYIQKDNEARISAAQTTIGMLQKQIAQLQGAPIATATAPVVVEQNNAVTLKSATGLIKPRLYFIVATQGQQSQLQNTIPDFGAAGYEIGSIEVQRKLSRKKTEIHYYAMASNAKVTEANRQGAERLAALLKEKYQLEATVTFTRKKGTSRSVRPLHYDVILANSAFAGGPEGD